MLQDWLLGLRKYCVSACIVLAAATGTCRADDNNNEELRKLLEQQAKQIQELKTRLDATETHPVAAEGDPAAAPAGDAAIKKIVDGYMAEKEAAKAAAVAAGKAQKECDGYQVGTDMGVSGKFNQYGYLWFTTANNDFTIHPGFWLQYDNVFFSQPLASKGVPTGARGPQKGLASGVQGGGVGTLEDGMYFRRIRPFVEGTLWENFEYRLNIAAENDQFSTIGLDEVWMGVNKLPIIGTIRAGHVKTVQGFEADMSGSSRTMTFMERSTYSEAIELNQNFQTGLWFENSFFNDHMTYAASVGRTDQNQAQGVYFGDGQWMAAGRLTALPWYENDGRDWLHLGVTFRWGNGTSSGVGNPATVTLQSRPALRDDDPGAQTVQAVPNANDNRMIATGAIAMRNDYILGTEFLWVRGPLSVQAEYGWNYVEGAYGIGGGTTGNAGPFGTLTTPFVGGGTTNYLFSGGYIQVAYTLTGEARGYDRPRGTLSREYFRSGPFTNAWFLKREHGGTTGGWGAWELAARYDYVNLNDNTGNFRIQGGVMNQFTAGVNWYLNTNFTVMFDYVHAQRDDVPPNPGTPALIGSNVGTVPLSVDGFGIRAQLSF